MEKSFTILWLAIIILLTGCTQEYRLERMYYHAEKKYMEILKNPFQANTEQVDEAIADFDKIIHINPNWDGIKNVRYAIAHLYFLKKDFGSAREKFKKIISDFPLQKEMCLQARCFIGLSYQQEDKWDKALVVFEKIMNDYPLTQMSMSLSHYIAKYYQNDKKYHLAEEVLRNAITKYEKIINDYPYEKRLIIVIEDFIIKTYEELNDWAGVVNTLQKIVVRDHNTDRGAQSLYRLAKIYESKNEIKKAINIYNQFIKDYPDHKFASIAKAKVHSLQLTLPNE
ncbi:MAG: tetratricopeptide repeat protein [bacterium]